MDRKALHDSAYQLYSEEFIAKEARGERSKGLSEEALTRVSCVGRVSTRRHALRGTTEYYTYLWRYCISPPKLLEITHFECPIVRNQVWHIFTQLLCRNPLVVVGLEAFPRHAKGIPSGQDIHQVLLELRVKVLTVSLSNWAAAGFEGRKKPQTLSGALGAPISAEDARQVLTKEANVGQDNEENAIQTAEVEKGESLKSRIQTLVETKRFFPPFYAVFLYFCDNPVYQVNPQGKEKALSRAERRVLDAKRELSSSRQQHARAEDEILAELQSARMEVQDANDIKSIELLLSCSESSLKSVKEKIRCLQEGGEMSSDDEELDVVDKELSLCNLKTEKSNLKRDIRQLREDLQALASKRKKRRASLQKGNDNCE
eukprot:scaffold3860_cov174-Pinguiococcus_pyrenoidosus.AAC.1